MAIKFKVSEDEHTALSADVQAMYKADGDNFVLGVEGLPEVEDTTGLKKKVEELLGEKKTAQKLAKDAQDAAVQAAIEKAKSEKDYKSLWESSEAERVKSDATLAELQGTITKGTIDQAATELAGKLTTDAGRQKLLKEQFASRLLFVDGVLTVGDGKGNPTVSTMDDLSASIKKEYPFLADGSKASGAGANGNTGGAGDSKTMSRADWDALDHVDRGKFMKDGGKLEI